MCVVVVWAPRGGVAGEMETLCDDKVQPTVIIVHDEGTAVVVSTATVSINPFRLVPLANVARVVHGELPFLMLPTF